MTDLSSKHKSVLSQFRLPGLDLGDGFVFPNYQDRSILNLPSTICHLLGAPRLGAGPLAKEYLDPLGDDIQRVVLILMDALALHRLRRWMASGAASIWAELAEDGYLGALTSITPSTTSAALTSLWTGRSPTEHGITGYEMWLKEYGMVINTILHTPFSFVSGGAGSLKNTGFEPLEFMRWPTLGTHLTGHGIQTYALQHRSILGSGLSTILFQDTNVHAFTTAADMWINLKDLLEAKVGESMYTWVYWSEVDHFGHSYGPDDDRTAAEFVNFSHAMETLFIDQLERRARGRTLLILTADHGQISTPLDGGYELRYHPELMKHLHITPTGENRLAYMHIRPGHTKDVQEYIERFWPGQFNFINSTQAIEAGLFGPGTPHPGLQDRIGDALVIARQDAYLWSGSKENHLIGRHGGLHPEEMLVPFLIVRL